MINVVKHVANIAKIEMSGELNMSRLQFEEPSHFSVPGYARAMVRVRVDKLEPVCTEFSTAPQPQHRSIHFNETFTVYVEYV